MSDAACVYLRRAHDLEDVPATVLDLLEWLADTYPETSAAPDPRTSPAVYGVVLLGHLDAFGAVAKEPARELLDQLAAAIKARAGRDALRVGREGM